MSLGIRAKFITILLIAAGLPVLIGLFTVEVLGYRSYRQSQAQVLQGRAQHLAQTFNLTVNQHIEKLADYSALEMMPEQLAARALDQPEIEESVLKSEVARVEALWPELRLDQGVLRTVLNEPLSFQLRAFQQINPLFRELMLTDGQGRLVAATNKTSDYWQADEIWWQKAVSLRAGGAWVEGIGLDKSADVYSLDIALPLHTGGEEVAAPAGVLKAVLNVSLLLQALQPIDSSSQATNLIVTGRGEIVARLFGLRVDPFELQISPRAIESIVERQARSSGGSGWARANVGVPGDSGGMDLIGFAPIHLQNNSPEGTQSMGLQPLYVLVYGNEATLLAPVWGQIWRIALAGALLLLGCTLVGLYIADRKIIRPLRILQSATHAVADTARNDKPPTLGSVNGAPADAWMTRIRQVRTRDEIEELARDFEDMAHRVLSYHQRLEQEVAAKTDEMQRDLDMAREFQEAFMTRDYPNVSTEINLDNLSAQHLKFHHIYQPATTVGGDFYEVIKLSEHRAGIFIADVMGHGARSALVTAILRTLLQDLATQADDPAHFLEMLNRQFYEIVQHSRQFLFVSAFYLVLDLENNEAIYASAGHPSPLVISRAACRATPLLDDNRDNSNSTSNGDGASNAALGLAPQGSYTVFSRPLDEGDLFVLFTDGVAEAPAPDGEEFGIERLRRVLENECHSSIGEISQAIMISLGDWMQGLPSPDDICLVAIEVAPVASRREAESQA